MRVTCAKRVWAFYVPDSRKRRVEFRVAVDDIPIILSGTFDLQFRNANFFTHGFAMPAVSTIMNQRRRSVRPNIRFGFRCRGSRIDANIVHVITSSAKVHFLILVLLCSCFLGSYLYYVDRYLFNIRINLIVFIFSFMVIYLFILLI